MKFTYSSGQRPLDGYTIKRGIGRGGFGEVYYGVSDAGKEVALKRICDNLDVELRGISQCLNLKHPNLIHLFDLRTDNHDDHWVIMEYVSGEPLNAVLARHPQGVDQELARQWFLGLASAVGYLHEHGIVHRDLKPANIFIEHGVVKVGDYGLCKLISGSQQAAQTQSVGTVHYMAPEISTGRYNRQIDIYAAGIILYEMLTGHVPFEGESAGEILMKHLTTPPDFSKLPPPFIPILDKALAKNTAQRYRTLAEMARDVERTRPMEAVSVAIPVRMEPGHLAPGGEPVLAQAVGNAGRPIAAAGRVADATLTVVPPPNLRKKVGEICSALLLAVALACIFSLGAAALGRTRDWDEIARRFFLAVSCVGIVVVPAASWHSPVTDTWRRRGFMMILGFLVGIEALWLEGYSLDQVLALDTPLESHSDRRWPFWRGIEVNAGLPVLAGYLSYFGLVFFVMRWWRMGERRRGDRFSLFSVLVTVFWAWVFFFFLPGNRERQTVFIALVMASIIIQMVSPWEKTQVVARPRRYRLRHA
jgi:hypothetical protein